MPFFHFIKRWQLAQKGMSIGKKRKSHNEDNFASHVNRSLIARGIILGIFFVVSLAVFLFPEPAIKSAGWYNLLLFTIINVITAGALFINPAQKIYNNQLILYCVNLTMALIATKILAQYNLLGIYNQIGFLVFIPFALIAFLNTTFLGKRLTLYSIFAFLLLSSFLLPSSTLFYHYSFTLVASAIIILLVDQARKRSVFLYAGFYTGITALIFLLVFNYSYLWQIYRDENWNQLVLVLLAPMIYHFIICLFVSGLLPMLESMLGITTNITWLEYGDFNHKLLKRMQLEAPGTFQHSLAVATLAEVAAEAIGANSHICRVCSYFHDIGKLEKPEYFIENQGKFNPHDELSPTMSALVIIAHVKEGVNLAIRHNLNPLIIECIKNHHGDSCVEYFYQKYLEDTTQESQEQVTVKNFTYPGPKPRRKEHVLVCLADSIESASRSLSKPTLHKIESLVDDIVSHKIIEKQLDKSEVTLAELTKIKQSFIKTLRSMMHTRIAYPQQLTETSAKKHVTTA